MNNNTSTFIKWQNRADFQLLIATLDDCFNQIEINKPKGLKVANSDQMADRYMLGHYG